MGILTWGRLSKKPAAFASIRQPSQYSLVSDATKSWVIGSENADLKARNEPTPELESAVSEPRKIEAHPPATVGSFTLAARPQRVRLMALLVVLPLALAGCSTTSYSSDSAEPPGVSSAIQPGPSGEPSAVVPGKSPTPMESKPKESKVPSNAAEQAPESATPSPAANEKPKNAGAVGGPGFESAQSGPPEVVRTGKTRSETSSKSTAPATGFNKSTTYSDGLGVEVKIKDRGKVSNTGPGFITGASYVVFTVVIDNRSPSPIDLNSVVLTLRTGKDQRVSAPLYGEVETFDFTGVVAPKLKSEANYAFMLPSNGLGTARLYVDIDSGHDAATISGTLDAS